MALAPRPVFIVVVWGTLTLYDGNDPTCTPHRYGPGTGFLDPGFGHVHIARNEGATPVTVVQTYLNVPPGGFPPDRRTRTRQLPVLDEDQRRPADAGLRHTGARTVPRGQAEMQNDLRVMSASALADRPVETALDAATC